MKNQIVVLERKCWSDGSSISDVNVWKYLGYYLAMRLEMWKIVTGLKLDIVLRTCNQVIKKKRCRQNAAS